MGARRGFICRMRLGNVPCDTITSCHTVRMRQDNTLGASDDGHKYAVVHVTGYIKNWSLSKYSFSPYHHMSDIHNISIL